MQYQADLPITALIARDSGEQLFLCDLLKWENNVDLIVDRLYKADLPHDDLTVGKLPVYGRLVDLYEFPPNSDGSDSDDGDDAAEDGAQSVASVRTNQTLAQLVRHERCLEKTGPISSGQYRRASSTNQRNVCAL